MFRTGMLAVLLPVAWPILKIVCVKTREQGLFEPAFINLSVGRRDIASPNTALPSQMGNHVSALFVLFQISQLKM